MHFYVISQQTDDKNICVQVLLAERSRVARRPEGEPTFHIFYRLLAGVEGTIRRELHLDSITGETNLFMTPLQKVNKY